jgi:hypothetical protein
MQAGVESMTESIKLYELGRLSGFLYGVCASTNASREYSSSAYSVDLDLDGEFSLSALMNERYGGGANFLESSIFELPFGAASIEERSQEYLIQDSSIGVENLRIELRRYLAFRLMDMVEDFIGTGLRHVPAFEMHGSTERTDVILFCIKQQARLLVLHFNRPKTGY